MQNQEFSKPVSTQADCRLEDKSLADTETNVTFSRQQLGIQRDVYKGILQNIRPQNMASKKVKLKTRKAISVFGLGYVGIVSSGCLSKLGHNVVGVDTSEAVIHKINTGHTPIVEPGLEESIQEATRNNTLIATNDVSFSISNTDISFVCVGTPSAADGSLDMTYLKQVSQNIGEALKDKESHHTVVYRSTMEPGTVRGLLIPILEQASGKKNREGFSVCFHPEFLREGVAVDDFFAPPKTVIGSDSKRASEAVASLYQNMLESEIILTSFEVAEMVKYVDNTWHAVKVSFANEIGRICQASKTDGHEVMDIFCQDTKLNLSPYYLKPGFAFGGSCLPKDVRGINKLAERAGLNTPLLNSIMDSNHAHIDHAIQIVKSAGNKRVAVLGLSFKKETDDLRETPTIPLIVSLLQDGYDVKVFDPNIKNQRPLQHYLLHSECTDPSLTEFCKHFEKYQVHSVQEALDYGKTIVVTHNSKEFSVPSSQRRDQQVVVDLVRLFRKSSQSKAARKAGVTTYLQKPVSPGELSETLEKYVDGKPGKGCRLLLAEDNIPMNTVLQMRLSNSGHKVDTVTNGREAVTMATLHQYDAILMDLNMPELDGIEASRQIRGLSNENSSIPIIALSAWVNPEQSATYQGLCW